MNYYAAMILLRFVFAGGYDEIKWCCLIVPF